MMLLVTEIKISMSFYIEIQCFFPIKTKTEQLHHQEEPHLRSHGQRLMLTQCFYNNISREHSYYSRARYRGAISTRIIYNSSACNNDTSTPIINTFDISIFHYACVREHET